MILHFFEDLAIVNGWLKKLLLLHFDDVKYHFPIELITHKRVDGLECDLIVKSSRGIKILCELKVDDVFKALDQVIARRKYFKYCYVVMENSIHWILKMISSQIDRILYNGIGIISSLDNAIIIKSYSNRHVHYEVEGYGFIKKLSSYFSKECESNG